MWSCQQALTNGMRRHFRFVSALCRPMTPCNRRHQFRRFTSTLANGSAAPVVTPFGDRGLILRFGTDLSLEANEITLVTLKKLNADLLPGVTELIPAYVSLLVVFDPLQASCLDVFRWVHQHLDLVSPSEPVTTQEVLHRKVEIPVRYGGEYGPDLEETARLAGLTPEQVIALHSSAQYRVFFLGFMGGFPYLGGLPEQLRAVPRLATPRAKVPAGSVGVAGGQTGVYPVSTPGGWRIIGRTSKTLFDPKQDPPSLLSPGDLVRFVALQAGDEEPGSAAAMQQAEVEEEGEDKEGQAEWVQVEAPGLCTVVVDAGRQGYGRYGVSCSGPADPAAYRLSNALVGNPPDAAALEVTLGGLRLSVLRRSRIAVTGADCRAHVLPAPKSIVTVGTAVRWLEPNTERWLEVGEKLVLGGAMDGARSYVAVGDGGVAVPLVLKSRCTDLRGGMGGVHGRVLKAKDKLSCFTSASKAEHVEESERKLRVPGKFVRQARYDLLRELWQDSRHNSVSTETGEHSTKPKGPRTWTLRVLPQSLPSRRVSSSLSLSPPPASPASPSWVQQTLEKVMRGHYTVLPNSDRMAVCLEWSASSAEETQEAPVGWQILSEGVLRGAIQLPPDGKRPVVLLAEHQATGGYHVPVVVIGADLWKLGQLRPGDGVRLEQTSAEEAATALAELEDKVSDTKLVPALIHGYNIAELQQGTNQAYVQVKEECSVLDWSKNIGHRTKMLTQPKALKPRPAGSRWIDLNADVGEGFDDASLLQVVTSANVACGGHAGDPGLTATVVALAARSKVTVGAHVSYEDRADFGRTALDTPPDLLKQQVLWQAGALMALCRAAGTKVRYMKPHGALYHSVLKGGPQAKAVIEAARLLELPLLLMPHSHAATFGEGFAERAYDDEHTLRPRSKPGAVLHNPQEAAQQALFLADKRLDIHSICIHGDSPNATLVALAVRQALERQGYLIKSFIK
eukprot:gb/GEZN01001080.1/.p1 GENE.gb/GEZN01001080.1/~~gb/GEZN01001080.1/.p1  ORF type:complete len:963 (-),score=155.82 gb/GEZN01001080.1/:79-2967(-)